MGKKSAGILLFRETADGPEVLLAHPGGPFWAKKDLGVWSIPKGEMGEEEDPLVAARREFAEETGVSVEGEYIPLGSVRYSSGKTVQAWAVRMDMDPALIRSNEFMLEWPPRSGRQLSVPEIDRAGWFTLEEAKRKMLPAQVPFVDRLEEILAAKEKE